jgi:hypothetical protein
MRTVLALLLQIILIQAAAAAPVDIACYWEKPGSSVVGAGVEAAKFYSKISDPAYFVFDLEKSVVKNADKSGTQDIILQNLSISEHGSDVEIRVGKPNIKGLLGMSASLIVRINPYTLQSLMMLTIRNGQTKEEEAHWLREGVCSLRRF